MIYQYAHVSFSGDNISVGITTLKKYIFMTLFIFLQCSAAVFPQIQAHN